MMDLVDIVLSDQPRLISLRVLEGILENSYFDTWKRRIWDLEVLGRRSSG